MQTPLIPKLSVHSFSFSPTLSYQGQLKPFLELNDLRGLKYRKAQNGEADYHNKLRST